MKRILSPEVQIALLTERIKLLTEHFKKSSKDHNSRRGLLIIVGTRRRLLNYLKAKNIDRYKKVIESIRFKKINLIRQKENFMEESITMDYAGSTP